MLNPEPLTRFQWVVSEGTRAPKEVVEASKGGWGCRAQSSGFFLSFLLSQMCGGNSPCKMAAQGSPSFVCCFACSPPLEAVGWNFQPACVHTMAPGLVAVVPLFAT